MPTAYKNKAQLGLSLGRPLQPHPRLVPPSVLSPCAHRTHTPKPRPQTSRPLYSPLSSSETSCHTSTAKQHLLWESPIESDSDRMNPPSPCLLLYYRSQFLCLSPQGKGGSFNSVAQPLLRGHYCHWYVFVGRVSILQCASTCRWLKPLLEGGVIQVVREAWVPLISILLLELILPC